LDVLKIFDDRQRLKHGMTIMNECRHNALGIDSLVTWLELFTRKNVDWNFFER